MYFRFVVHSNALFVIYLLEYYDSAVVFFCSRIVISSQLEYMNKDYKYCCFIPVVTWCNVYLQYICNIFAIQHYYSTTMNNTYMYTTLRNNKVIIIILCRL